MSRYERITYAVHDGLHVVDVRFTDPQDAAYPNGPTSWTRFGNERTTGVELDESDVRELHAKFGEFIAGWDAS
jgi:hypothetical protein